MKIVKTIYRPFIFSVCCGLVAFSSYAAQQEVGARAVFLQALGLSKTDMDFGVITYAEGAGANTAQLSAVSGALTCDNASYQCSSSATRGTVSVQGSAGVTVNIFCEEQGTLAHNQQALPLQAVHLALSGTAYPCHGLNQASAQHVLGSGTNTNMFYVGASLVMDQNTVEEGVYDTANAQGNPITVRVVYQ